MKPRIFISYRRDDASGYAGRLADHLEGRFGDENVFRDIEDLEGGTDFQHAIVDAVSNCGALVVIMGPDWLDVTDPGTGERRLDDPDDYVRLEIEAALERDVLTLPVLVRGARVPTADDLPESLAGLTRRQALPLSDDRWSFDVERVIRVLEPVVHRKSPRPRRRMAIAAIALITALAAGFVVFRYGWLGPRNDRGDDRPPAREAGFNSSADPGRSATDGATGGVPAIVGLTLDSARVLLQREGLQPDIVTTNSFGRYGPGIVFHQIPSSGTPAGSAGPISVFVEFDLPADAVAGGQRITLESSGTFNLDGPTGDERTDWDLSVRGSGAEVVLSPGNGAVMAVSPRPPGREPCRLLAGRMSADPIPATDALAAEGICVRTNDGRLSGIRIGSVERRSGSITFGYLTW